MRGARVLPPALAVLLALTACAGAEPEEPTTTAAGPTPADDATTTDGATTNGADATLPDPCALIPADELVGLYGGDPGTGELNAPLPDERAVCIYSSGLILAVEVAGHWEPSVQAIRDSGFGTVEDVDGVGEAAIWQDTEGGTGQFLVLGEDHFVGATVAGQGRDVAEAIASAMLDRL